MTIGLIKVIDNVIVRYTVYDSLTAFYSNYVSVFYHFRDTSRNWLKSTISRIAWYSARR